MILNNLKQYFADAQLSVEASLTEGNISEMPIWRRMVQFFNTAEVRKMVGGMYEHPDLIIGGTFSGMPVVGIITLADNLSEEEIQKLHSNDDRQTRNLWRAMQDENYFKNWSEWALYYSNVASALSGIFCLRYFVFENHENFEKYKNIIRKMKSRQISPVIGVYGFACDVSTGEVVAPRFVWWLGAGAFSPKNISAFLKNNTK